jgi:hypothetical protein
LQRDDFQGIADADVTLADSAARRKVGCMPT